MVKIGAELPKLSPKNWGSVFGPPCRYITNTKVLPSGTGKSGIWICIVSRQGPRKYQAIWLRLGGMRLPAVSDGN